MSAALWTLLISAASIGFIHTLIGPDHYIPFIAMAKARSWSIRKTFWVTVFCGVGHVLSSVAIGLIGIAAGIALKSLEETESARGDIAAWLLTAFGLLYMLWGVRQAIRNRPHTHKHLHADEGPHEHTHTHQADHLHVYAPEKPKSITPWILFTIFLFGPCEPLIPLLMFPAAAESLWGVTLVTLVFAVATIGTMTTIVMLSTRGLQLVKFQFMERYTHAMAGAIILMCGVAIHLGL